MAETLVSSIESITDRLATPVSGNEIGVWEQPLKASGIGYVIFPPAFLSRTIPYIPGKDDTLF